MTAATTDPKAIFFDAVEIQSPVERAAFLAQACGDDASLRARVEALLQAHDRAGQFLGGGSATVDQPTLAERAGTVIGPYKLLQQIGEGGMGVVWMAEQEKPVRRRVALKIIKPGMDSQQVIARFEAERQALAMMEHQNIARVYDAGTTDSGRPYFVMELVHGVPITKYCDDNHLTPRERLALFVPVCHAIQHAHQKGIIHRDIKPSNIMVCLYDGKPVPKIIDFGVAKATEQRLTDKTLFTSYGSIVGTFEYMSPEQSEMSQLGIDTRSDIYSLGVLLYELLTGTTPLDRSRLKNAAIDELLRIIREEEPPKPSTRLSESKESLPSLAALRKTEPAQLAKLVRGDLDWIVMKCLEKDRQRRYDSAVGLAKELERYLHDEPVEARPPSARYRTGKFLRKNRAAVMTTATVAASLLLGMSIAALGYRGQNNVGNSSASKTDDLLTAKLAAERAQSLIGSGKFPEADAALAEADKHFRLCRNWRELAQTWLDAGIALATQHFEYGRAQAALQQVILVHDEHIEAFRGKEEPPAGIAYFYLAYMSLDLGDDEGQLQNLQQQIELESRFNNSRLAEHEVNLASCYTWSEDQKAVELFAPHVAALEQAVRKNLPFSHWGKGTDRYLLTCYYVAKSRQESDPTVQREYLDQALQASTHATGEQSLRMFIALESADYDEAIECNRRAFEGTILTRRARGGFVGIVRSADEYLVRELVQAGRVAEAEGLLKERIADWKREVPLTHPVHAHAGVLYGQVLREQKKYAEAQLALDAAFKQLDGDSLTPPSRRVGVLQELVALHQAWGKPNEAQRYQAMLPPDRGGDVAAVIKEVNVLIAAKDLSRAKDLLKQNLHLFHQPTQWRPLAWVWNKLGHKHALRYDYAQARACYERAIAVQLANPAAFQGISDQLPSNNACWNLSWVELDLGDLEASHRNLDRLVQLEREFDGPWRVSQELHRAMAYYFASDLQGCVEAFAPHIASLEASESAEKPLTLWASDPSWGIDYDRTILCFYNLARARLAMDATARELEIKRAETMASKLKRIGITHVYLALAKGDLDAAIDANQRSFDSDTSSFELRDGSLFTCLGIQRHAHEVLIGELIRAGRLDDAEKLVAERAAAWKRLVPKEDHPIHAHVGVLRGRVLREQKNYAEAQDALKKAFEQLKDDLLTPTVRRDQALQELVALYDAWNKPDEAQRYRAMLSTATPDERELAELNAGLDQAFIAYSERRRPQAENLYQQALPILERRKDYSRAAWAWHMIAKCAAHEWRYREAIDAYDRAIALCTAHPELFRNPVSNNAPQFLGQRAAIRIELGDDLGNLQDLEQAFAIAKATWGPDAPNTHSYQAMLAGNLCWMQSDSSARVFELLHPLEPVLNEAVTSDRKYLRWGIGMEQGTLVEYHLAGAALASQAEVRADHLAKADTFSQDAVAKTKRNVFSLLTRSRVEDALKKYDAAVATAEEAQRVARQSCPNGWLCVSTLRLTVVNLLQLHTRDDSAAAEKMLQDTRAFLHEKFPDTLPIHALILQRLGRVQRMQGNFTEAKESLTEAKRRLEQAEVPVLARIKEIDEELVKVEETQRKP